MLVGTVARAVQWAAVRVRPLGKRVTPIDGFGWVQRVGGDWTGGLSQPVV